MSFSRKISCTLTLAVCLACGATLFSNAKARAQEPEQLTKMREVYISNKNSSLYSLMLDYSKQLENLEITFRQNNNTEAAAAINAERDRIQVEMNAIGNSTGTVAAAAPAPAVVPEPVQQAHVPQTYVSDVEGFAGAARFSKNNKYTFNIPSAGPNSRLTFHASGRSSVDTKGTVYLVTPDGKRHEIYNWSYRDFEKPAEEAGSYKKLKPITADITEYVKQPGPYTVEFIWKDSIQPLIIKRVELYS